MRLVQNIFIFILCNLSLYGSLENYGFFYYGTQVGTIENFENLDKGYLKVRPENLFTKLLIKNKKQLVLYTQGKKPNIENSFYFKDKLNFITIVNEIKQNPRSFIKELGDNKRLVVIYDDKCYWSYIKNEKIKSQGYIIFDKHHNIIELKDISHSMEIKILDKKRDES